MENLGEQFLHQRDPSLHISPPVRHETERRKKKGEKISSKPADKLANWMRLLERTHLGHRDDPRVLERIREFYHKRYVIKPGDIPESYFENQRRLAREQGYGDIEITDELRRQAIETIIADQKSTLDCWIDYFISPGSDSIPMWAKYWAFTGMLKLSTFDKEKHVFGKRDKNTVAPFPDLNREALAYILDAIIKKAKRENIPAAEDNSKFKKLLEGANFGKLYAWAIEKVTPTQESELTNVNGKWIKYPQGSDYMPLVRSLQGHGTGWCTAGEETARYQLQGGDFYVYYSYDRNSNPTIPRIAIRMERGIIAEVRGIGPDQNLDPYIAKSDVLDRKLKEFGQEGEKYKKRSTDMKRLTEIDHKVERGEALTKEDLRFLYEFDGKIEGFGYKKDPRIQEIIRKRDTKADLSLITGFSREQISTTEEEALKGNIKYHYGSLGLRGLTSAEGLKLPESIGGSLYLWSLTLAEGLKLPESIGGDLDLKSLTLAEGLKLPESIDGSLDLSSLTSAKGLKLPESIGGDLDLSSLTSAEGLELPESIDGSLYLSSLTSAEGLELPESIDGDLDLRGLTSAEGLELPKSIGGSLYLWSLTSAERERLKWQHPNLKIP